MAYSRGEFIDRSILAGKSFWILHDNFLKELQLRFMRETTFKKNLFQDLKDFMRQVGEVTYADAHSEYEREGYVHLH